MGKKNKRQSLKLTKHDFSDNEDEHIQPKKQKKSANKNKKAKADLILIDDTDLRPYFNNWQANDQEDLQSVKLARKDLSLSVRTNTNCPSPLSDAGVGNENLPPYFTKTFTRLNISTLSSLQRQAWPAMLDGVTDKDVKCFTLISPTGSGKTLTYAVPLVYVCMKLCGLNGSPIYQSSTKVSCSVKPFALVLVPTRELAQQVYSVVNKLVKFANEELVSSNTTVSKKSNNKKKILLKATVVYGGIDKQDQLDNLPQTSILIATPGRLLDLLSQEQIALASVMYSVIDECDRMCAGQFGNDVNNIFKYIRADCARCFVSATVSKEMNEWVDGRKHVSIMVKEGQSSSSVSDAPPPDSNATSASMTSTKVDITTTSIPSYISQILHVCATHKKERKLMKLLTKLRSDEKAAKIRNPGLCMVFFNRITSVEYMYKQLNKIQEYKNGKVGMLHSKMPQKIREKTLDQFKCGKIVTLLATDVAGRGIHCNSVKYVINYDFTSNLEQYVHRCGRLRSKGCVYSFFTKEFHGMAQDLLRLLRKCNSDYIDPNLVKVVDEQQQKEKLSKKIRDEKKVNNDDDEDSSMKDIDYDDDGQFRALTNVKPRLERAGHVSDASKSEDSDEGCDEE